MKEYNFGFLGINSNFKRHSIRCALANCQIINDLYLLSVISPAKLYPYGLA